MACMVRHFLNSVRGNRRSGSNARRKLTDTSPLGPLLLGFLRYFGPRFKYTSFACLVDGSLRRKSDFGIPDGPAFVLLNPLESSPVNCAASAFRMAEISTTFAVIEQQIRDAAAMDLSVKGQAPYPTVLSSVVFADPLIEERRKQFRELRSLQRPITPPILERSESGKAPRKTLKIDMENSVPNSHTVQKMNMNLL